MADSSERGRRACPPVVLSARCARRLSASSRAAAGGCLVLGFDDDHQVVGARALRSGIQQPGSGQDLAIGRRAHDHGRVEDALHIQQDLGDQHQGHGVVIFGRLDPACDEHRLSPTICLRESRPKRRLVQAGTIPGQLLYSDQQLVVGYVLSRR